MKKLSMAVLCVLMCCGAWAGEKTEVNKAPQNCAVSTKDGVEQQGCCSWHQGVCSCSGGSAQCCDGTLSPTCGCHSDDPPAVKNKS